MFRTIEERGEAFAAYLEKLDAAKFRASDGDAWTIAELAGHVAEFPRTFASEAVRLATNLGATVGRNLDDDGRLAALKRLEGKTPEEAAAMVRQTVRDAVASLRQIAEEQWDVEGTRKANGDPITVRGIVENFIADHLRGHVEQARATAGEL
jgi:hypothetical protein